MPRGGQLHTEATKQLLRDQKLGVPLSRDHAAKIAAGLRGKRKTPEHRAAIAAACRGRGNIKTFKDHWLTPEGLVYILGVDDDDRLKLGFTAQPIARRMQQIRSKGYRDWLPKGATPRLLYSVMCIYPCQVEKAALKQLKAQGSCELVRANIALAIDAIEQAAEATACC